MYGPTNGVPLTEDLPYAAADAKGRVRAQMAQDLLEAHAAGRVRATIGRASDYFGPGGLVSHMGERVFYPLLAGKKAQVMGDPDQPHTFSYIPDLAAGLMTLGARNEADGKAWHLPNPDTVTPRRFIERIGDVAGVDAAVSAMPRAMVNVVGWFNKNVREIKDVLYQFEHPFVVDSTAFTAAFGEQATGLDDAISATVEWYRANPK
jgi:nucleoside-diphosphate-sugar epimerase